MRARRSPFRHGLLCSRDEGANGALSAPVCALGHLSRRERQEGSAVIVGQQRPRPLALPSGEASQYSLARLHKILALPPGELAFAKQMTERAPLRSLRGNEGGIQESKKAKKRHPKGCLLIKWSKFERHRKKPPNPCDRRARDPRQRDGAGAPCERFWQRQKLRRSRIHSGGAKIKSEWSPPQAGGTQIIRKGHPEGCPFLMIWSE